MEKDTIKVSFAPATILSNFGLTMLTQLYWNQRPQKIDTRGQ